jgi:hypothetical protein
VTERARYALETLLGLLGLKPEDADGIRPRLPPEYDGDWDDPRPDPVRLRPPARLEGFDLLYATYACLTAPWERVDPLDEVGCPIAAGGWLARNGLLREPLVHRYAALLGALLRVEPTRSGAIVLTHDVDDNFEHLFGRRARWELLRREPSARRLAGLARRLVAPSRRDPNDRFDDWGAWHRGWRSRPAYFVASHGLLRGGDPRDVAYDVRHPEVRDTLRRAVDGGAEIGVHFSIDARASAGRLRAEREALEEVVSVPVRSSRHHWWAVGPTLDLDGAAGIEVECSYGFNDLAGFRRGIAAPFLPFGAKTGIRALPTIAMDAAVRGDDLGELWRTTRGAGGLLVLDWHVHSAATAEPLRRFLDQVDARFVTPLEAIA